MFRSLEYFPPSPAYGVKARLARLEKPGTVAMTTIKGTTRPYLKYGIFELELRARNRVSAVTGPRITRSICLYSYLSQMKPPGKETYGAGRYVDIEET